MHFAQMSISTYVHRYGSKRDSIVQTKGKVKYVSTVVPFKQLRTGTVSSEIFAKILISRIVLKHIFATLKICDKGVIYLFQ